MKKLYLSSLLFLCVIFSNAQEALVEPKNVEFSITGGLNYALLNIDGDATDINLGFNVGGSAEYYLSESWGIKAKIMYDQKGWEQENTFDELSGSEDIVTDLNYLTLPLLANWHFGKRKHWYLNFGVYTGIYLDGDINIRNFEIDDDAINSTDFGLAYGIGVKIPISENAKFVIEWDAQVGLLNVLENEDESTTNSRGAFNVGIAF